MLEATLNFLTEMAEKPVYYITDPPPGVPRDNAEYDPRTVEIEDARTLSPAPRIDRQGFELVHHETSVGNLFESQGIRAHYFPEVEALVARLTGAERVLAFDHNLRSSAVEGTLDGQRREVRVSQEKGAGYEPYDEEALQTPVRIAHNDYTDLSAPQRVRDLVGGEETEALLRRRFAFINVWKPIRGPVECVPLAVCDATSLGPDDLVESDLVYEDRIGRTSGLVHKPGQRWFYYPGMQPHEALLLKCYDSDRQRPRFTAHSAFDDPTSPSDAAPRESIEVRTLAFFSAGS